MSSFSIGLSGLEVAQRAIELAGTNIANAATPGYHRQDPTISSIGFNNMGYISIGGAEITRVRRAIDLLLERQLLSQRSNLAGTTRELSSLRAIENTFGNLETANGETTGLDKALKDFFSSLMELNGAPGSNIMQANVVAAADGLASQFRSFGEFFDQLDRFIVAEAENVISQINGLTTIIADLNEQISATLVRGGSANILQDSRDQAISELAELIDLQVAGGTNIEETMNVLFAGGTLVSNTDTTNLEINLTDENELGISIEGTSYYLRDAHAGTLGGLMELKNVILPKISDSMNLLANQIISTINQYHVQGIGEAGSFTELTGWLVPNTAMENWDAQVSSGSFFVRVKDTVSGAVTRTEIAVDPSTDTLADIRDRLNLVNGISASIANSCLTINADVGKEFDFLPVLLSEPYDITGITGSSDVTVSGVYNGSINQILTCTVTSASGDVGNADGLLIEIRNEAGELIDTIDVGLGYEANQTIETACGIKLAFTAGTLNNGDVFTIQALASSDTSGFLAGAGINTFFSGNSARAIAVCESVLDNPKLLASSLTESGGNLNVLRMSELANQQILALGNSTPIDFYQQLVADVGRQIDLKNARHTSIEGILQQLSAQWGEVSGVDINEEAAKLMMFEQMFQAMAKHISVQQQAIQYLMEIT